MSGKISSQSRKSQQTVLRQMVKVISIEKVLDCIIFMKNQAKDLHLMSSIKLHANDFNIVYCLFQMLEDFKDDT